MSKLTVEELEVQAEEGKVIKEVFELVTYRDPNHPDVIRKKCPKCGKIFDKFLLCIDGLIGCNKCAAKDFVDRGIALGKIKADELIAKGLVKLAGL